MSIRPMICLVFAAAILSCFHSKAEEPEKTERDGQECVAQAKIKTWNSDQNLGIFKRGKSYFVFRVSDEKTIIRVDSVVKAHKAKALKAASENDEIWTLSTWANKTFKPRVLAATGYGIEPLPTGKVLVQGVTGYQQWRKSVVKSWTIPITAKFGEYDVSLSAFPNEKILVGYKGAVSMIKKKRLVQIEGQYNGEMDIMKRGTFVKPNYKAKPTEVVSVPVIEVSRLVFIHRAFSGKYQYMVGKTLDKK